MTCIFPIIIIVQNNYDLYCKCCFQQIRASDIWRESEHEDLQHRLLDYHVKVTMKGTEFYPPAIYNIKFEGSTDDSLLDIRLEINDDGMTYAHCNLLLWEVQCKSC